MLFFFAPYFVYPRSVSGYVPDALLLKTLNNSLIANGSQFYFDYQDGKYGFNTDPSRGADTFSPFSGGGAFKLLYTRPTEKTFAAETILTEDMTQYDGVLVIVGGRSDYDQYLESEDSWHYRYCPVGSTVTLKYDNSSSNQSRTLTVTETEVSCGACSTGAKYCLPNAIYGVKLTE